MSEVSQPPAAVEILSFSSSSREDQERGLLGWLAITVGPLQLDGVALRQAQDGGRLYLAFPTPTDRHGKSREVVRPRNAAARREIECQVLAALDLGGGDAQ